MRRRTGSVFVLVAAALLALCLPLAMVLAGSVLAPRAWAKRARDRETFGHRRVYAASGLTSDASVIVRQFESARGVRLELRAVAMGNRFYGELVPVGREPGAVVLEGGGLEELVTRGTERWDADAKALAERECDAEGRERERVERHALFTWLVAAGMPREAAARVAGTGAAADGTRAASDGDTSTKDTGAKPGEGA